MIDPDDKKELHRIILEQINVEERHNDFKSLRSLGRAIAGLIGTATLAICAFLWNQNVSLEVAIAKLDLMQARQGNLEVIAMDNQKAIVGLKDVERRVFSLEEWRRKREDQLENRKSQ